MDACLFCGQEGSLLCRDCDRYTKARNRSFLHSFSKKWRMTYEEAKEKRKGNKAKKSGAWPTKQNRIPAPFKNEDTSDEDTSDEDTRTSLQSGWPRRGRHLPVWLRNWRFC